MKLTRRELAAMLASGAAVAQTPPPASSDADLEAARQQVKANASALAQVEIPMSTEPAFKFEA